MASSCLYPASGDCSSFFRRGIAADHPVSKTAFPPVEYIGFVLPQHFNVAVAVDWFVKTQWENTFIRPSFFDCWLRGVADKLEQKPCVNLWTLEG